MNDSTLHRSVSCSFAEGFDFLRVCTTDCSVGGVSLSVCSTTYLLVPAYFVITGTVYAG